MNTSGPSVFLLDTEHMSLAMVGGKGQSLATLAAAGLPVPAGFLLSTDAYRQFVRMNELRVSILEIVATVKHGDIASAEL
ncbi:MAG: hypothetical protein O7B25_07875, partial [Gammaproteobacteria bacterium]|nr:hypothetical protein [Gammaproteobacteria bacterium]